MNIVIPLGGKGERFYKEGFDKPKPLIPILNKPMIFHVFDHLSIDWVNDKVFIIYHIHLDSFDFSSIVLHKYPGVHLIPISYQTAGACETLFYGLPFIQSLSPNKQCVLFDCDTFYTQDILHMVRTSSNKNLVFYTKVISGPPIYSYIEMRDDFQIYNIKEKEQISSNANTGCYVFEDIDILYNACNFILKSNITFQGEPYTSCVISYLIDDFSKGSDSGSQLGSGPGLCCNPFYGYELEKKCVFSVGTPRELKQFVHNTFVFLFDLDGTLVYTDDIYFDVWSDILLSYKIILTPELFQKFIHGNSDDKVIQTLIPNAVLSDISALKDQLFIQSIHKIKIMEGVDSFFKHIRERGYSISIVTNCNRTVAEHILSYCNWNSYIDFITVGAECVNPKPYPDPYLETVKKYSIPTSQVIIFEDSKSGLLSGRLANPRCLVGITSNYSSDELIINGAHLTYSNFTGIDLNTFILYNHLSCENIKKYIVESLNLDIRKIDIDETKLKGGYISDVLSLTINLDSSSSSVLNCVLKLENKNETKLSIMAKKLGLYERENYFYDAISKYVNVHTPLFYGLIKDNDLNIIGILMENLYSSGKYTLNLNLNKEPIEISLGVINELAKLHSKYWNKDIKKAFPELKLHNDPLFNPCWTNFIQDNWNTFKDNWSNILTEKQLSIANNIKNRFSSIQQHLSNRNLTLIHGDVKSPNLFYSVDKNYKPVFLDWQYVAIGKGVQDMIFFLIESFDLDNIKINFPLFKNYYYKKLLEYGVHYTFDDYEQDIQNAVCYFPFFVAVWFGTTPQDELIDVNFPFFFIQKLFFFLDQLF